MQRKISALLENGVNLEEMNKELEERVEGLENELLKLSEESESAISGLEKDKQYLEKKCIEVGDMIERVKKEKDGLARTCKELSGALGVVRSQHENAIEKLKGQFEARFTQKLTEVYQTKEEELKDLKLG